MSFRSTKMLALAIPIERQQSVLNPKKQTMKSWLAKRWMEGASSCGRGAKTFVSTGTSRGKSCYRLRSNSQFSCNSIQHVRGTMMSKPSRNSNRFRFNARVVQFVSLTLEKKGEHGTWSGIVCYHEAYMTTIINKSKRITTRLHEAIVLKFEWNHEKNFSACNCGCAWL